MSRRAIEERFKDFQARFSEASSFNAFKVNELFNSSANNESILSFIETTFSTTMKSSFSQIIEVLQTCMKELKARLLQQAREFTSESTLFIFSERSRTQKISDSSLFSDDKESIWNDWHEKIKDKLSINADFFSNEQFKLSYVFSRLVDSAAKVTRARRNSDSINLYKTVKKVLKELVNMFDDLNKEENVRRKYEELTQKIKKFSKFFAEFQQLFIYLKYNDKQLLSDLKKKINSRLRLIWANQSELRFIQKIWLFLIHFDNEVRVMKKQKNKESSAKARLASKSVRVTTHKIESTKMIDTSKSRSSVWASAKDTSVKKNDLLIENCFVCHKSGHIFKECSNRLHINALDDEFNCSSSSNSKSKN